MLSCAKARATGSQACTRRSGLRAMTCPSVTADVGNMLHRARPRWAIAKFCADILANRVGGGSPGCRGGGGGCVSGCVGHCGLGAGYVARYAAVVSARVALRVCVRRRVRAVRPLPVAVRDCATVCRCAPVVRTSNGHNAPHSTYDIAVIAPGSRGGLRPAPAAPAGGVPRLGWTINRGVFKTAT
jgi:hypothetical protein